MAKLKFSTRLIAYTALMTALTYAGTLLGFSGGQFYFNLGDSVILICASMLGPIPAMIAGGLGSFLGDLTVFPATMVYTLFVKGIEGLVAGLLFMLVKKACARYFARHMSAEMKAYMSKTENAANAANDEQADGQAEASQAELSQAQSLPAADVVRDEQQSDDAQIEQTYLAQRSEVQTPPAAEQNAKDMQSEQSAQKNAVFENIKALKKRAFALQCLLSLPVCLFSSGLMAVGYFICQTFMYGTYASAMVALPLDAVQATVSSAIATAALAALLPVRQKLSAKK